MPSHRPMTIARTFILTLALLLLAIPASRAQDPQPQSRDTFAAAIKKALPSVVGIQVLTLEPVEETSPFFNHPAALNGAEPQKTRTRRSGSSGSGVIAMATKDTGLIITNFHVIQDAERIGVRLTDGRAFEAHLVGRDAATDIAVLSVEAPDLKPITFSPRKPQVGDVVLAIGGPFGLDATATMGIVSNLFRSSIRYRNFETRLCVVDVENSAFYGAYCNNDPTTVCERASRIEGIGRPRVEPSFIPGVIDHMIKVPDAASIAAMHVLSEHLSRRVGGSTGTNFFGLCWIARAMMDAGEEGSLVSLICDSGDRSADTYYNPDWLAANGLDIAPYRAMIETFVQTGRYQPI